MTTLRTISGRKLEVTSNADELTYTIQTEACTYKTGVMSLQEFEENENNTGNDWQQFLNDSCDYYRV